MNNKRIVGTVTDISMPAVHDLYARRAESKTAIDVDAPVVLCSDKDPDHIKYWNEYEQKNMIPLLNLDKNSNVLELGFGTGRVAKYIIPEVNSYTGIDYVSEFVESVRKRKDIVSGNISPVFIHGSFEQLVNGELELPRNKYNRFVISGGTFMYINDKQLKEGIAKLGSYFEEKCVIYISEPIAITKRLTLNEFFSDSMNSNYSAIYRTDEEYQELFSPFYNAGFKCIYNREFFEEDIKGQKETKQWMYVLSR